ncbi:uncharacterized protein LOC107992044 [Cucumis melo]|uniref:Uncharacterized protein LOC107992044 n=2 Tax=Cucumis melo TaxID=3656 RepID=A0A1S4E4H3_CUCME|nr:uncharacterized protein LOC107992044 [Cucumis melo]
MLRRIEMVGYFLTIPEIKTRAFIDDRSASSNNTKESVKSRKFTKRRNSKRKRRESMALYTKKTTGQWKIWRKKNLKYKGNWIEEVQVTMMLVATVIATVTFQAGVNHPGGVWQQDTSFSYTSFEKNSTHTGMGLYSSLSDYNNRTVVLPAGTSIMVYQQEEEYWIYLWINTVSFLASMSLMLMIVSRFLLQNRICSCLLTLATCIAVVSLAIGYLLGVKMVNLMSFSDYIEINPYDNAFPETIMCCLGVVGMVGLWQLTHFLKSLFHIFTSKLKSLATSR